VKETLAPAASAGVTEQLCGFEISAETVSRATTGLDAVLQEWRERPLGEIHYLFLDARYEKVREAGQIRDAAVLVATGISPEGERQDLGVSVSLSEQETHWKAFLKGLKERGLHGVQLVTSDTCTAPHLPSTARSPGGLCQGVLGTQCGASATMKAWVLLEGLFWAAWPGSAASFTCNRMLEPMCHIRGQAFLVLYNNLKNFAV
jgi:hypothetical protein